MTVPQRTRASADPAALVLAGGGARAAYEIGVLHYLFHEVGAAIGAPPRIDVLCGTSAGAINVSVLAAYAGDPAFATDLLVRRWSAFAIERVLVLDLWRLVKLATGLIVRPGRLPHGGIGAFLDPGPIAALLGEVPFEAIGAHLEAGRLAAVGMTATQIATGKSVLFLERRADMPLARLDPAREVRDVALRPEHALASAAIPLLFPPVRIDGELYCDGGLRPDLPLATATALGARRLLVVSPHSSPLDPVPAPLRRARESVASDPLYVAGKAIDALMNDHGDEDLDRMQQSEREAAASSLFFRPSQRIGVLAAELVRTVGFRFRSWGLAGTVLRALTDELPEADMVSYLLFDGEFSRRLIELGRSDARSRHDELCALFAPRLPRAAAVV